MKVLFIDNDKIVDHKLHKVICSKGFKIFYSNDSEEGMAVFKKELPDVIFLACELQNKPWIDMLKEMKLIDEQCKVILTTHYVTYEAAVQAFKLGIFDYLAKPISTDKLLLILDNIKHSKLNTEKQKGVIDSRVNHSKTIIGNSKVMIKILETIEIIAQNDYTILIEGESGTGKELVAKALHDASKRKNEKFIPVNCSIIPENLIESELFGHEKGSFTGAIKKHEGYFERADKGTIFLDDIDDIPHNVQIKLLRVLQEKEFVRVGGTESIKIDTRIITATKVNLKRYVDQKLFRDDLFYRINTLRLLIPPLRERTEDIPILVEHFFRKHGAPEKFHLLTNETFYKLINYDWPGNVRELENIVERMIVLLNYEPIDDMTLEFDVDKTETSNNKIIEKYPTSYQEFMTLKEKEIISWALTEANNNIAKAAKLLNLPRTTLFSKIIKLNIKTTSNNFTDSIYSF
jgi:DNA-binding NtrC family response regulator